MLKLLCKKLRGQVPVAGIRQQHHDVLARELGALCQLHSGSQSRAGADAYQHALLVGKFPAVFEGLFISDGQYLIVDLLVQGLRHEACSSLAIGSTSS